MKITPNLWFNDKAEEASAFYISLFENSSVQQITTYTEAGKEYHAKEAGSVMLVNFELNGQSFAALNGGERFTFNSSISLFVEAPSVKKVESLWSKLIEDGEALMELDSYPWSEKYGWLRDKFGLQWQLMYDHRENAKLDIATCLFFCGKHQGNAEKAINFYSSVFKNHEIFGIQKYTKEQNEFATGHVMHAQFNLEGRTFMAMDSGMPMEAPFNEAFSLVVNCENQEEIDYYWNLLTQNGDSEAQICGWLKDQFGVSWQVVPTVVLEFLQTKDLSKKEKVMAAIMQMQKIEIAALEAAFNS
ncbi:VOC family protein [Zhouia sp. PK063]|uniref:VOC family protein n=1 Tax=Zhouia sp. PK063 TaxID=3373602 RepID=UPI0037B21043